MRRVTMVVVLAALIAMTAGAQWVYNEHEDLMSGTIDRSAAIFAEAYQGTLRTPLLVIRTAGEEYEVFIHWGGYNMDRDTRRVVYGLDGGPPEWWAAEVSTNREATFVLDWEYAISVMLHYDGRKLVVQADRATGVVSVARFDLTGIGKAIRTIDGAE